MHSLVLGLALLWASTVASAAESSAEERRFEAADGSVVHADLHRAGDEAAPLVLLFHQAGGDARGEYGPIVPRLLEAGYHVLAVDQRSGGARFGGSNRTVAGRGGENAGYCEAYPDLEAALAHARSHRLGTRYAVWGSSYSAALVLRLAAEHPGEVDAVLAFSPASGPPMGDCAPGPFVARVGCPTLALRPASEMQNPAVRAQLEQMKERGFETHVADPGVHGSSMLVAERVGGDVETTWGVVLGFLERTLKEVGE